MDAAGGDIASDLSVELALADARASETNGHAAARETATCAASSDARPVGIATWVAAWSHRSSAFSRSPVEGAGVPPARRRCHLSLGPVRRTFRHALPMRLGAWWHRRDPLK